MISFFLPRPSLTGPENALLLSVLKEVRDVDGHLLIDLRPEGLLSVIVPGLLAKAEVHAGSLLLGLSSLLGLRKTLKSAVL